MTVRWLLPVLALCACTAKHHRPLEEDWKEVRNTHARCFAVQWRDNERRILVFGPGGRTDTLSNVNLPVRTTRMAVLSTTHVPYLLALGSTDHLVGVAHGASVRDTNVTTRLADGRIVELLRGDRLDHEALLGARIDLLFDQPFGRSDLTSRVEGPRHVMITEYLEEHPLGRSEWIRAFGAILGQEAMADSIHASIVARYEAASRVIGSIGSRPSVFYGSAWQGRFHGASSHSLMAQLVRDAGGTYWSGSNGPNSNVTLDLEGFLAVADTLDHVGMALEMDHPPDALDLVGGERRIAAAPGIVRGGFYGNSGTSDLFGRALLEPDVMLSDLILILHPELPIDHRPTYFHRLDQ